MKTGQHLKIRKMGDAVMGVTIEGNPKKPEPIHFRVVLPFGDVDITRCTDGQYWVHIRVQHEKDGMYISGNPTGKFTDARIDIHGKHAVDCSKGDLGHPDAYHVAVKVGPNG